MEHRLTDPPTYALRPVGVVESELRRLEDAPMQGDEGAPDAWLMLRPDLLPAVDGVHPGDELLLITWLQHARRDLLTVHPRGDVSRPLTGVFATRAPHRPNALGLHRVRVLDVQGTRIHVSPLEAVDGTPIVDIKPVLREISER